MKPYKRYPPDPPPLWLMLMIAVIVALLASLLFAK